MSRPAATWRCFRFAASLLGNVSLSTMLTGAVLDTSYLALVMYAGATVLVALFRVLLARPGPARPGTRSASSLIDAGARIGRTVMAIACVVIGLQAFRIAAQFSITPPKASAVMISQMVSSMLSMPPRDTSMSMAG